MVMATISSLRKLALKISGVKEEPYRHGSSLRFKGKVMATLWEEQNEAIVNVLPEQQEALIQLNAEAFYPVQNSWGKKGWTTIRLGLVLEKEVKLALNMAADKLKSSSN